MNTVYISGRMIEKPSLGYISGLENEQIPPFAISKMSVAVDLYDKTETNIRKVDVFPVVALGKRARYMHATFEKGSKVIIQGELRSQRHNSVQKMYILLTRFDNIQDEEMEKEDMYSLLKAAEERGFNPVNDLYNNLCIEE